MNESAEGPDRRTLKYRQGAWVFLSMNLAYILITWWKLPPMGLTLLEMGGYTLLVLVVFGALSRFVYRGSRTLTLILSALYGGRALYAGWTLLAGSAFPLVPWVLPTIVIAFYFLARPVWDWP